MWACEVLNNILVLCKMAKNCHTNQVVSKRHMKAWGGGNDLFLYIFVCTLINTAPSAAPSDSTVPEVAGIGSNPGLLRLWHWLPPARIDVKISLFSRYDPGDPRCQPIYERRVYKRRNYKGDYWHTERYTGITTKYIYIEHHSVCPLVGIGTLPSPLSPASERLGVTIPTTE